MYVPKVTPAQHAPTMQDDPARLERVDQGADANVALHLAAREFVAELRATCADHGLTLGRGFA